MNVTGIEWLTIREACRYLKVSRSTLYNWERAGRLDMYRFGRSVRIRRDDLHKVAGTESFGGKSLR
jgi:excisionase family DNA binding protein